MFERTDTEVLGIDFTSRPCRSKQLTAVHCSFTDGVLRTERIESWDSLISFEQALLRTGPWVAGIDFPFGQSRKFISNIGWPNTWAAYVSYACSLGKEGYCEALSAYKAIRPRGDKEHRRQTDRVARSISPQKLHFTPVGLMFFEGAPRLLKAGVMIPHIQAGDPNRVCVEAYPALLARRFLGRRPYKTDNKKAQTRDHHVARLEIMERINRGDAYPDFGFRVENTLELNDDPTGDQLDALLCAIQAAWAWTNRHDGYGAPGTVDPLEGWIADPLCRAAGF